jgi:hypothetical protein
MTTAPPADNLIPGGRHGEVTASTQSGDRRYLVPHVRSAHRGIGRMRQGASSKDRHPPSARSY